MNGGGVSGGGVTDGPDALLAALRSRRAYRDQIVHVERVPGRPARHRATAAPLPPAAQRYLDRRGIELYRHQALAVDAWRAGHDVLLATRTASGKSLAFDLAMAEALQADPNATALYLFPTKALARDQLAHLAVFDRELGLGARPMAYDGDTPQDQRARARSTARLICTNPYGLHEYLPQNRSLAKFLSGLAIVVVDEAHHYRGLFGTHVALVLRRLQRICARLGATPRFVLASGTIANPGEHGAALIGRPVAVVDDDGAEVGQRVVALWDSLADPNLSAITQAAGVVATLARRHCRTLCFTGSRLGVELVGAMAADRAPEAAISPYRAGFTPAERREIEQQLRDGQLDAVVSTNALELGIDIGGLDSVVLTGYPGTVASTWQQIGRAGRGGQDSLAVLVAGDDALDQYFVRRPEILFRAPVERAATSLDNPNILTGQVLCAAAELPLGPDDPGLFGPGYAASVADLEGEGLISRAPAGLIFAGGFRAAGVVRLDGRADDAVEVRVDGEVLEVLERWRAMRSAHEGAILIHRGQRFRIRGLDLDGGRAEAELVAGHDHTESVAARDYRLAEPDQVRRAGDWELRLGDAWIRQQVTAYKRHDHGQVVATVPLDLPPVDLQTRAVSMSVGADRLAEILSGRGAPGSLHAAEHGLIHAMPLLAMCDRNDACGISTVLDAATGDPLMLLYDGHAGGAGIAELAFDRFADLAGITLSMVESCDCELGCPRCVYDRNCGNGNRPMNRPGAVAVLGSLL